MGTLPHLAAIPKGRGNALQGAMKSIFDRPWPEAVYVPALCMKDGSSQARARYLLMQTFYRLKIPQEKWPSFDFISSPDPTNKLKSSYVCNAFQPPSYDCLSETFQEWAARANALWLAHVKAFKQWADKEVRDDEASGELIKVRRRRDTDNGKITERLKFEWTALKLSGHTYTQIVKLTASETSCTKGQVTEAVHQILRESRLDVKGNPIT